MGEGIGRVERRGQNWLYPKVCMQAGLATVQLEYIWRKVVHTINWYWIFRKCHCIIKIESRLLVKKYWKCLKIFEKYSINNKSNYAILALSELVLSFSGYFDWF